MLATATSLLDNSSVSIFIRWFAAAWGEITRELWVCDLGPCGPSFFDLVRKYTLARSSDAAYSIFEYIH